MMKYREKRFSGVFPVLLAVMFFKTPSEKILSTAREIQEIPIFRQKSAVPAIFRKLRLQKSVLMAIESCLMVNIVINNSFA